MNTVSLKRVMRIVAGQSPPSDEVVEFEGTGLPFLQGNAEFGPSHPVAKHRCDSPMKRAETGDILLSVRAPVGALNIADRQYGIGRGLAALRPVGVDARFAWWSLHAGVDQLRARATGSTFEAITADDIGSLVIPIPAPSEQREIADFLDAETARIDALIERKRRMIRLLGERWTTTRRHAVTRGLDSAVPSRPTGADWLSEVPAHWRTSKLPHLGHIQSGSTPSTEREDYWDGDIPWVSPKDMKQFDLSSTEEWVSHRALEETGIALLEPGVVLFVVRGMILAHTFPVAVSSVPVTINQDMKALAVARDDARFVAHLLAGVSHSILSLLVEESAHGTRVLRMERWKDFPLFLPPVEEQRAIAAYLDREAKRTAALVSDLEKQIDLLREHRQALITAAVTGQLDVASATPRDEIKGSASTT